MTKKIDYSMWKQKIVDAKANNETTATIHYFGFLHAQELKELNLVDVCRKLDIGDSYKVEFNKMINLYDMIQREIAA